MAHLPAGGPLDTAPRSPTTSSTNSTPKASSERPRAKSHTTSSPSSSSLHKRSSSGSGSSILSRLPFFKAPSGSSPITPSPSAEDTIPFPDVQYVDDEDDESPLARSTPAIAAALGEKSRRRTSSLRKAALLGPGKLRIERRASGADITKTLPRNAAKVVASPVTNIAAVAAAAALGGKAPPARRTTLSGQPERHDSSAAAAAAKSASADPTRPSSGPPGPLSVHTRVSSTTSSNLLSPITSPTGPYASTISDDDGYTISSAIDSLGSSVPHSKMSFSPSPPSSETSSVTNPSSVLSRRASSKVTSHSPLSIQAALDDPGEWDYAATEWWGWIILVVTWAVFVVGMGSCLEVWSWAWDVGETPYAPPELEDDPTLPIVGYYPALIILTAVMSWVWVVVAWMGMKYFKHARTHDF